MRAQLDDLRARGDALALLWATESGIYGRYGYGVATRARSVRVRASRTALRPSAPSGGTVRVLDRHEIVPVLTAVHDTLALRRPGGITRTPGWWEVGLARHDDDPLLVAVHSGQDGRRRVRPGRAARRLRRPDWAARCGSRTCTPPTPRPRPGCGASCSAST